LYKNVSNTKPQKSEEDMKRQLTLFVMTGISLAAATGAYAQIGSINSAVITPRVYNDYPSATGAYINNYPSSITLGESGEYGATGFANKDIWQFSNDGTSAYAMGAGDTAFTISATLTLSPETGTLDNEAGWIIPSNGTFPGGDMFFIAKASQDHFLGFFGGPGFWNSGISYTAGTPVTMTMAYWQTGTTGNMQFSVDAGSGTIVSPVQSWTGNLTGDTLGAYFQLQGTTSSPGSSGQAVWSDITVAVPEPSMLALLGLGIVPLLLRRCRK
jgi:hypothetical protein